MTFITPPEASKTAVPVKPLSVRVMHSFAEAESLRSAWNDLVTRSGTDVYQTFEWSSIWWKYYGTKRELHLLFVYAGEELVGLIPAFIETRWLGLAWVRVAKLVGADYSLTLCNLAVMPAALRAVTTEGIDYFLGRHRCDLLLFGPLSGPSAGIDEIVAAGSQHSKLVARAEALGDSCNTYFTLPESYEDYLKSLDKKQRSNSKRMIEQSSKAHRVTFDTISAAERITPEFEDFFRQHEIQWRADGKLGHFGDWPHAGEFNRELIRTLAGQGMVRFYRILADDKVVSSQYCFVMGRTVYWRLPARVRSTEWDRFSLGTMGLVKMIEALIPEGVRTIEGGRGHYGYKMQYGAREWPLRTVQFMRRGAGVAARVRLFKLFVSLLEIAYYKIIFMRLAPKLPFLQRAIWPIWIRSSW